MATKTIAIFDRDRILMAEVLRFIFISMPYFLLLYFFYGLFLRDLELNASISYGALFTFAILSAFVLWHYRTFLIPIVSQCWLSWRKGDILMDGKVLSFKKSKATFDCTQLKKVVWYKQKRWRLGNVYNQVDLRMKDGTQRTFLSFVGNSVQESIRGIARELKVPVEVSEHVEGPICYTQKEGEEAHLYVGYWIINAIKSTLFLRAMFLLSLLFVIGFMVKGLYTGEDLWQLPFAIIICLAFLWVMWQSIVEDGELKLRILFKHKKICLYKDELEIIGQFEATKKTTDVLDDQIMSNKVLMVGAKKLLLHRGHLFVVYDEENLQYIMPEISPEHSALLAQFYKLEIER